MGLSPQFSHKNLLVNTVHNHAHTVTSTDDVIGTAKCVDIFSFLIWQYPSQIKAIYFIFVYGMRAMSATNEHRHIVILLQPPVPAYAGTEGCFVLLTFF